MTVIMRSTDDPTTQAQKKTIAIPPRNAVAASGIEPSKSLPLASEVEPPDLDKVAVIGLAILAPPVCDMLACTTIETVEASGTLAKPLPISVTLLVV